MKEREDIKRCDSQAEKRIVDFERGIDPFTGEAIDLSLERAIRDLVGDDRERLSELLSLIQDVYRQNGAQIVTGEDLRNALKSELIVLSRSRKYDRRNVRQTLAPTYTSTPA